MRRPEVRRVSRHGEIMASGQHLLTLDQRPPGLFQDRGRQAQPLSGDAQCGRGGGRCGAARAQPRRDRRPAAPRRRPRRPAAGRRRRAGAQAGAAQPPVQRAEVHPHRRPDRSEGAHRRRGGARGGERQRPSASPSPTSSAWAAPSSRSRPSTPRPPTARAWAWRSPRRWSTCTAAASTWRASPASAPRPASPSPLALRARADRAPAAPREQRRSSARAGSQGCGACKSEPGTP